MIDITNLCSANQGEGLRLYLEGTHKRKAAPQGRRPGANLHKTLSMQTIAEIARDYPQMSITIPAADLLEFGKQLVADTMEAARQEEAARSKESEADEMLTAAEACKFLGITDATLWRWRKRGYISSQPVGGRIKFKKADCRRILNGGEK